jgi:DNA polymerase-1
MDAAKIAALAELAGDIAPVALPLDPTTAMHVDGDYAAYYFSGNDETTLASAKSKLITFVRDAKEIGGVGGQVIVHLSHGLSDKGGRFKIASVKPYQGQRDSSRKPKNWEQMRGWLEESKTLPGTDFRVVTWMDREADDGVAAAARYAWESGNMPVILSRDKDFRMIPGRHIVWTTLERHEIRPETWASTGPDSEVYGQKWFWMQMLAGDSADNIPGLEKQPAKQEGSFKDCGMACAEVRLMDATSPEAAYGIVKELYQGYYGASWADRFVEQAALLWLRVDNDAYVGDFMRAIPARDMALETALVKLEKRIR